MATFTLTVNVRLLVPSLTVTATVSVPVKPGAGLYTILPAFGPLVMVLKVPPPLGVPNDVMLIGPVAPLALASGSST